MKNSPLEFAKNFNKFKSQLKTQKVLGNCLILLSDFWHYLQPQIKNPFYQSYVDEYKHLFKIYLTSNNLKDLKLEECESLLNIAVELEFKDYLKIIQHRIIQLYCYVGEFKKTFKVYFLKDDSDIDISEVTNIPEGFYPKDALGLICERLKSSYSQAYPLFQSLYKEWELQSESLSFDQALCLFVEKNDAGNSTRSLMCTLKGSVNLLSKSVQNDEIIFDNKLKTPDDPFVGIMYNALVAVRNCFALAKYKDKSSCYYHAHFSVKDSSQAFSGDSIGLAVAILTFTQLMKTEILRYERFISGEVAFTGGIDKEGNILPVNENTLSAKIERAFFSPVRYLVLPYVHIQHATEVMKQLNAQYPHRELHLIASKKLAEVIDNKNILRSEKVCIGEYTIKKVATYSRMAKIQIPLLLGLIWLLLAIAFPKQFNPWFDWHIDHIEIVGDRFKTVNVKGQTIWTSKEFSGNLYQNFYNKKENGLRAYWAVDVDKNGHDELFFISWTPDINGKLQFYSDNGTLLWQRPCFKKTNYPGDTEYKGIPANMNYGVQEIIPIIDEDSNIFVMTSSEWSPPVRHQFFLFDIEGNIVSGPYLHTGSPWLSRTKVMDINHDGKPEVFICATNNRFNRATLLVLDPKNLNGVSPPYNNELFKASKMDKGSQLYYVAFPETELSKGVDIRNYVRDIIPDSISHTYRLLTVEGCGIMVKNETVAYDKDKLPEICYTLDSNFIPVNAYIPDWQLELFNNLIKERHEKTIKNVNRFLDSLISNTIVYYGDSIVYNPAAGIYFHKK